ncbi:MAG TPA: FtsH protease activity modulator HflK [Acetobacteraceae bacterium]|nr:FtsH protease activity modulator HflK [Acetobacteraceae bacterium]
MPWNNGGSGPWGSSGKDPDGEKPGSGPSRGPDRTPPDRPSPGRGPWGNGGRPAGPQLPPELDRLIAGLRGLFRSGPPGGGFPRRPSGDGSRRPRLAWLVVPVLVVLWLASGFYRVQPDQTGVVLRFGAFAGTTGPGLHYHWPWPIERVVLPAATRINRIEIGYRSANAPNQAATRDLSEESLMLTGDENIVDVNVAIFWRISNVKAFLFNIRHPAQTVKAVAESVMREVMGRTPIEPALTTARAQIEQQVQARAQAILDQYGAGVAITEVQLQRVDPPPEVIASFRDVQRANTDAQRLVNEADAYRNDIVPRARGAAAQIIAAAEGEKLAAIAKSQGQAARFLSVLAAYRAAKQVTMQRLYIETMQDVITHSSTLVLDNKASGVLPLLPLNGLAPPHLPVLAPTSPAPTPPASSLTAPPAPSSAAPGTGASQ